MTKVPETIAAFLAGRRIAVAGVSRQTAQVANAVYRKLRSAGFEVFPVNPNAAEAEGVRCYPDVGSVPGPVDGVVIAAHPDVALSLVRQCADSGVKRVWFHRSIGQGSVSADAVRECGTRGIACIVGGCPLMYCEPVDGFHRCLKWWLGLQRRVPR